MWTTIDHDSYCSKPLERRQDSDEIFDVGPGHLDPDLNVPSQACRRHVGGSDVGLLRIRDHDLGV